MLEFLILPILLKKEKETNRKFGKMTSKTNKGFTSKRTGN